MCYDTIRKIIKTQAYWERIKNVAAKAGNKLFVSVQLVRFILVDKEYLKAVKRRFE